jgi:hypothetical protein
MPKEQGVPEIITRPELRVVILGIPCFEGVTWHKMHQVKKNNTRLYKNVMPNEQALCFFGKAWRAFMLSNRASTYTRKLAQCFASMVMWPIS